MGAITDRLDINLQDVKQWLQLPLNYNRIQVQVLPDPPVDTEFSILITYAGTQYEYAYTTLEGDTPADIATALVTAMTSGALALPTGFTVTNLGDGLYQVRRLPSEGLIFTAYVSRGQRPDPMPEREEDQILEALLLTALDIADEYCNNPFASYDEDGELIEEFPIPNAVRTGVLQIVSWLWIQQQSGGIATGPVKKRKAGKTEIEYATTPESMAVGGVVTDLPILVRKILSLYRFTPGV